MKRIIISLSLLSILSVAASAQEQAWRGYIPNHKREREKIESSALSSSASQERRREGGSVVRATWLTDAVARAKVSKIIDEERITNEQAENELAVIRPLEEYVFYVVLYSDSYPDPLNRNSIFLQRADDRKIFARGITSGGNYIGGTGIWNSYFYRVTVPKKTKEGYPIVRELNDEIELSMSSAGGTVIVKYKIKSLVTRLEDL